MYSGTIDGKDILMNMCKPNNCKSWLPRFNVGIKVLSCSLMVLVLTEQIAVAAPAFEFSKLSQAVSQKGGRLIMPGVSTEQEGANNVVTGNMSGERIDWFFAATPWGKNYAFNMEQKIMASKSGDNVIIKLAGSKTVTPSMTAVVWSPNGKMIATAGDAMHVLVLDSRSLTVMRELSQGGRGGGRNNIAFSPDGRYLASGLKTINIWDTTTWKPHATMVAPHVIPGTPQGIGIESLAFSPDGKLLVVAYQGMKWVVIAYQVQDGKIAWSHEPARTIGSPLITTPIVFTPDGGSVIFGTGERGRSPEGDPLRLSKVLFLDSSSGALRKSIDEVHMDSPTALAISRDGKWIATGTSTGVTDYTGNIKTNRTTIFKNKDPIRVWDVETGKLVSELPVASRVWALAFSGDGNYLVSSRSDIRKHMTVDVWRVNPERLIQQLEAWPGALGLAVSPDGKQIAAAAGDMLSIFDFVADR